MMVIMLETRLVWLWRSKLLYLRKDERYCLNARDAIRLIQCGYAAQYNPNN